MVATEEESELKTHLKWARNLVKTDGRKLPREVCITRQVQPNSGTSIK